MELDINEEVREEIIKGELARLYMTEISNHFVSNNSLSKDKYFECGKKAVSIFRKELGAAKEKTNGI